METYLQFQINTGGESLQTRRVVIQGDRWHLYSVAPNGDLTVILSELPSGGGLSYIQLRSMGFDSGNGLSVGPGGDAVVFNSGANGTLPPGGPHPLNAF